MIQERAIVIGIEGNLAIIQMQRESACCNCELNSGCGMGAIGRLLGHRRKPLTINNEYNLKAGDRVLLGLADHAFLKASLLIYGLPLVGLIGGGLLAQWVFSGSELHGFIFAVTGFIAGLWCSGLIAKINFSQSFNAKILDFGSEPKDRF